MSGDMPKTKRRGGLYVRPSGSRRTGGDEPRPDALEPRSEKAAQPLQDIVHHHMSAMPTRRAFLEPTQLALQGRISPAIDSPSGYIPRVHIEAGT